MLGGYKVQGADIGTANKLIADAKALEKAGVMMLTLECVPDRLAELICKKLLIPVTGIGSGPVTDGQTLNVYDILGLFEKFNPKFVKKYANLSEEILKAIQQYGEDVAQGNFPGSEHSFHIKDEPSQEDCKVNSRKIQLAALYLINLRH